jgi:predicted lipoprotein
MRRALAWLVALAAVTGLLWLFPLFHIMSLKQSQAAREQGEFNAAEFAKTFWNERLLPSLDRATDADKLMAAIDANPKKVREQYGRTVGISSSCFFFLRGSGRVVSATKKGVELTLKSEGTESDVLLPTGLLFGNTVRDATGLLDSSAFPNSQNFNDLSTELNRIVETRVLPELKSQAVIGRRVQFVGCAEVADEDKDLKPLVVIPVSVKVES